MNTPLVKNLTLLLATLTTACQIKTPQTQHPTLNLPTQFYQKTAWNIATPRATQPPRNWWNIFHDPQLNHLIQQLNLNNQSLQATIATADQARALTTQANASLFPNLNLTADTSRSQNSAKISSSHSTLTTLNWEIDLFGQIRHQSAATLADAQAQTALTESTRLSLQAQTAQTYFSLRAAQAQINLLNHQIQNYQTTLQLTQNRYNAGVSDRSDLAQAQAQLAQTQADATQAKLNQSTLFHALALLLGTTPNTLAQQNLHLSATLPTPPTIHPSTPSQLLLRRPDISAAERQVAAANERIGAAKAAFFPTLTLSASAGWRGTTSLLKAPTEIWALGPALAQPLLDQNQRLAQKLRADATHRQTIANYRQTVLTALQETEDALAATRLLAQQLHYQQNAVTASRQTERITLNQYRAGTLSYLNVVTAQTTALNAEKSAITLQTQRLTATIQLLKALGGNW